MSQATAVTDSDPADELRSRWDEFEALLAKKRQQDSDALWVYEAVHEHFAEVDQS